ncbi:heterokaryon incompatibility protein-domain-containing protein [Clohesyomyces aquaticus]|uniref:Heterokaryon incompatibility protein-domain-containing protein n=1 Tax=Clohesyomyces aquaticus TaxID=1231657 RepID=A0A1Y1ZLL4_9PLEO|nr:heterokaryon incompatibility protein-domain-containing protein [Clohesyomyces aquaticus]
MQLYQQLPLVADRPVIRLVHLRLNTDTTVAYNATAIEGSANTYDLRDVPDYDALSYAWGPRDLSAHITLNGESFAVSQTLFAALHQICLGQGKSGGSRKLWIDAICINQLDNVEKSHQVMLMRDIYAKANTVHAWIGEPDHLSALAFDTLERFSIYDGPFIGSSVFQDMQNEIKERQEAIRRFVGRGYWVRMWIVQEVVVATNVKIFCGSLAIDYDNICIALQRMTGSGFYPFSSTTANLTYIGGWRSFFHRTNTQETKGDLDVRYFLDSRGRSATNPRDKIYALRGIVNKALGTLIEVDYNDTTEAVYTNFSKAVLRTRPDLQILSSVILRHEKVSKLDLPSYVPDWTLPSSGGGILQRYYRFKTAHLFHAAGVSKPRVTLTEKSNSIRIEGTRLDTVALVVPIKSLLEVRDDDSVSVDATILQELTATVSASKTYSFTGEPSWVAYFRTLTADRTTLSPRIDEKYLSQHWRGSHHSSGDFSDLSSSDWAVVSKEIGTIIEDKDIFLTTKGYLGLGHEGFMKGDVVCILSGGEVPFLLRETAQRADESVFRFLCECYVHGVMDGEAVSGNGSSPLQKFLIE